jgi:hypothetical protein
MTPARITTESQSGQTISCDQALQVARLDAERAYRDLSPFCIQIVLEPDGWHIDYELKNTRLRGGGPHYVIDARTGTILSKRYEQ